MPGESICWAGMPNSQVIFHSDDWVAIPFSLIWTSFFVFCEGSALGKWGKNKQADIFLSLWGIPFLVLGNYMVWGRFLSDAWLKRRTFYAVTNRRVLIVQNAWRRETSTTFLEHIPSIEQEGTVRGTLWLGPKYPVLAGRGSPKRDMSRFSIGDVPVFADIDDVDSVHRLIMELRGKGRGGSIPANVLTYK